MDLSISPGILFKLKEKIESFWLLKAFKISHSQYIKKQSELHFVNIAKGIDCDIQLENKYLWNNEQPVSKLYIKTTKENEYTKLTGYVIANDGNIVYQNPLDIVIKNEIQIIVFHLPNIPLKEIYFDDSGIRSTFSDVRLQANLADDNCNVYVDRELGMPTYTEFLNSKWERKWGTIWNLDFLEREYQRFYEKSIYRFLGPFGFVYARPSIRAKQHRTFIDIWRTCLVKSLLNEKFLRCFWWITLRFRIKQLKSITNRCS